MRFAQLLWIPFLAALRPINDREDLVIVDFRAGKTNGIAGYKDMDVIDFEWVSTERQPLGYSH